MGKQKDALLSHPAQGAPLPVEYVRAFQLFLENYNFQGLRTERVDEYANLILEVGDAYLALGKHQWALHYYELLDGNGSFDNVRSFFLGLQM